MRPITIGHFLFMISYLKMSTTLISSSILLCREKNRKALMEFPWSPWPNVSFIYFFVTNCSLIWWLKITMIYYFSQFKGLAGLVSPGSLMSHIQLGFKVQKDHTVMSDSWRQLGLPDSLSCGLSFSDMLIDLSCVVAWEKLSKLNIQQLKVSWGLNSGTCTITHPPFCIGQRESQSPPRFKGWGRKPHLLIEELQRTFGCFKPTH